ncbi:unnamed protein product [Caretta caretta]
MPAQPSPGWLRCRPPPRPARRLRCNLWLAGPQQGGGRSWDRARIGPPGLGGLGWLRAGEDLGVRHQSAMS